MTKTEQDLTKGRSHHDRGEYAKAEAIYNRVLKREPNNIHARFFLGSLYTQRLETMRAIETLESVVEERPDWEEARNNLGVAYQQAGRITDALAQYERAIEINPEFSNPLSNRSLCLHLLRRHEAALEGLEKALELDPKNPDVIINMASTLRYLGRMEEAKASALQAYELSGADSSMYGKIGDVFMQADDVAKAKYFYEMAIDADPSNARAYNNLAVVLERTSTPFNRYTISNKMLELFEKAVELQPSYMDANINRASTLQKLRRLDEAREIFENVIEKSQNRYDVFNNYGATLQDQGKYQEAIELFKKAMVINDTFAEPWYNWGACIQMQGDPEGALEKYKLALDRNPNHTDAHSARGLSLLTLGRFEEGWAEYEWRKKIFQFSGRIIEGFELDVASVAGKRVLLHAEQGQGDTLQFIRYGAVLKKLGAKVAFECHNGLKSLMETCPGLDEVRERAEISGNQAVIHFDMQANLLSLPYKFGTTLDTIPSQVPYLHVPEGLHPRWTERVDELTPPGTRLKVGIVWAGNPGHHNDVQRSTTLDKFRRLCDVEGVTLFSLQKGEKAEEQLENIPEGMRIVPMGHEFESFGDTSAVMENLDLVIAVDTSVVHLAGALGLPVWTIIPVSPDFRWMLEREDTPWYPTMRLFRQYKLWDWDGVFDRVTEHLAQFAADPVAYQIADATAKFERGDRDCAKVQLLALTRRYGHDTRLINAIGEFFWIDGNVQHSLEMFIAAMQINPNDRRTVANCVHVLSAMGQKTDADSIYERFIQTHPEDRSFLEARRSFEDRAELAAAA